MHQSGVPFGVAPYQPNSLDNGGPPPALAEEGGYVQTPRRIDGDVVRANPASFDDHFSQATMFYQSLTTVEQAHIVEAFTFELGKCYEQSIKERELEVLAKVDADLCAQVASGLGLPAPAGDRAKGVKISGALSQVVVEPGPIPGRKIGVIADAGSDLAGIAKLARALKKVGASLLVIAPYGGVLTDGENEVVVERTLLTARSIKFDALVVSDGTAPNEDVKLVVMLQEAYRHCKAIGAWGSGAANLESVQIAADAPRRSDRCIGGQEFRRRSHRGCRNAPCLGSCPSGDGLLGAAGRLGDSPRQRNGTTRCGDCSWYISSNMAAVSPAQRRVQLGGEPTRIRSCSLSGNERAKMNRSRAWTGTAALPGKKCRREAMCNPHVGAIRS